MFGIILNKCKSRESAVSSLRMPMPLAVFPAHLQGHLWYLLLDLGRQSLPPHSMPGRPWQLPLLSIITGLSQVQKATAHLSQSLTCAPPRTPRPCTLPITWVLAASPGPQVQSFFYGALCPSLCTPPAASPWKPSLPSLSPGLSQQVHPDDRHGQHGDRLGAETKLQP